MERTRRAQRHTPEDLVEGRARYVTSVRVIDLSPSGALVESERSFEKDSEITIELQLERFSLAARARVVHCSPGDDRGYRAGVEFIGLGHGDREQIRSYIRERLTHERRQQPRIFIGTPATLNKEIELRVINLSLFGGLFSARFPLEFGGEHDFVFTLPQGEVCARGVVRHCEAWAQAREATVFELGVEFTELTGANRERVIAYLEQQIQAP